MRVAILECSRRIGGINYPSETVSDSGNPPQHLSQIWSRKLESRSLETPHHNSSGSMLDGDRAVPTAGVRANRNAAFSLPIPHHALYFKGSHTACPPMQERSTASERLSSVRSHAQRGLRENWSELESLGTSSTALTLSSGISPIKIVLPETWYACVKRLEGGFQ
jgi:hypothetical protein